MKDKDWASAHGRPAYKRTTLSLQLLSAPLDVLTELYGFRWILKYGMKES